MKETVLGKSSGGQDFILLEVDTERGLSEKEVECHYIESISNYRAL